MESDPSSSATAGDLPTSPPPTLARPAHRPKSPPLAFEKTPNDSLLPLAPPADLVGDSTASPVEAIMGRLSPSAIGELDLQVIIDQQANAIQLLHEAFSAERQVWCLEKERLYHRIANLERLLKSGDHWRVQRSPAKSPALSPSASILSPLARAATAAAAVALPTITEDDRAIPLSSRREAAPKAIHLPGPAAMGVIGEERRASFASTDTADVKVEQIPPPEGLSTLSPPPAINRMLAGHTPVRVPRPPTPPPQKMSIEGIEDTPTRNNTHINTLLTQLSDEEEDAELKGPLNMPELPNQPDATNFTLEMLSKKLELIEKNPDQAKPLVFSERSPGLASPVNELATDDISPNTLGRTTEAPIAPRSTRDANASERSSSVMTPSGTAISPQGLHDPKVHERFEQGGIKLKKKASINFGAPFGQLGGFSRNLS